MIKFDYSGLWECFLHNLKAESTGTLRVKLYFFFFYVSCAQLFFFGISTIYFLKSRASIFLFVNHVLIHFICLFLCVSLALIRSFVFKKGKRKRRKSYYFSLSFMGQIVEVEGIKKTMAGYQSPQHFSQANLWIWIEFQAFCFSSRIFKIILFLE